MLSIQKIRIAISAYSLSKLGNIFMSTVDYWDNTLFGNDAAEEEQEDIFSSYAFERDELKYFLDEKNPIQIVRAFKGEGKSALLRMVGNRLEKERPSAVVVLTTGVATSPSLTSDDSDIWVREWKKNILKLLACEIGTVIGFAYTDDAISLVEESERNGFKKRSFVSSVTERIKSTSIPIKKITHKNKNHEHLLKRYLEKKEIHILS